MKIALACRFVWPPVRGRDRRCPWRSIRRFRDSWRRCPPGWKTIDPFLLPMLRDPHQRINTTSFGLRQAPGAPVITSRIAILLHTKRLFFGADEPIVVRTRIQQRLPAVEENATNDRQRHDEVF